MTMQQLRVSSEGETSGSTLARILGSGSGYVVLPADDDQGQADKRSAEILWQNRAQIKETVDSRVSGFWTTWGETRRRQLYDEAGPPFAGGDLLMLTDWALTNALGVVGMRGLLTPGSMWQRMYDWDKPELVKMLRDLADMKRDEVRHG